MTNHDEATDTSGDENSEVQGAPDAGRTHDWPTAGGVQGGRHRMRHRTASDGWSLPHARSACDDSVPPEHSGRSAAVGGANGSGAERVQTTGQAADGGHQDGPTGADDVAGAAGAAISGRPAIPAETKNRGLPTLPDAAGGQHEVTHQVTLRTPAELADALPYLLGYRPEDSIVLVALHDRERRGRIGGRARLGIPANEEDWPSVSEQLTQGLIKGSERRGARPESMVAYLCQEPGSGESGHDVMERLRPLAQLLRTASGRLDVPVIEALCISDGRFWSYTCPGQGCCPPEGSSMGLPGTSVLAAAATYAGLQVRGSLRELTARLTPWETTAAPGQEVALDTASMAIVPRILDDAGRAGVAEEALALARRIRDRLAAAPAVPGMRPADLRDDGLLEDEEAATLILALQDRATRDRAAEWMEGDEAGPALRLWRALARRCVGPYREHAAAPLTLAGWVAWSTGDELEAREALAMALGSDPDYLFARLLHQACNEGLDPESIRRCLRAERTGRGPVRNVQSPDPGAPRSPADAEPDLEGESHGLGAAPSPASRRRRRTRMSVSASVRPPRRGPGAAGGQRSRPVQPSRVGDRPGRAGDKADGQLHASGGDGGGRGAEEDG
ncbi:DUF4192 domain-containing protein [Streptomyces sp. M41(2017)]|uniref:DUF4192 domain-containing protein n=1 Tax=Streptomyces sp. M41(2017) TaxID=1955065 RepID=UPI001F4E69CC|nr:DUF4192 domain-containing protein [Streptomyces sp. M41(2017)]